MSKVWQENIESFTTKRKGDGLIDAYIDKAQSQDVYDAIVWLLSSTDIEFQKRLTISNTTLCHQRLNFLVMRTEE